MFSICTSLKFLGLVRVIPDCKSVFNPFPQDKILDQPKLKAFADDTLNVTKMVISVFDRVENMVGKGEIACTSNFSFSHHVFKKASFPEASKGVIVWEWVNPFPHTNTF